jgi:hypothetical protein
MSIDGHPACDYQIKTIAYYPLHYGAEYLEASIRSIYPCVDKILILYSSRPTFGYNTDLPCPETEEQLKAIALSFSKVEWINVDVQNQGEGTHRDIAFAYATGYDLLLAVDADEVWDTKSLSECLGKAYRGDAWRYNILGFKHFWKSFNHVCEDSFAPGRIFNLNRDNFHEESIWGTVYHFGYAQSKVTIDYKMSVHGHKAELRKDWPALYESWKPGDTFLHPASRQAWPEAMPFDKTALPGILKQHPNFNKDVI